MSTDKPDGALLPQDAMSQWTSDDAATAARPSWLSLARRVLEASFCDRRGHVSRPKLLFSVMIADLKVIVSTGLAANALIGAPAASIHDAALISTVVALAVTVAMHRNWSYTIHALRQPLAQLEKIVKSTVAVFCLTTGAAAIAGFSLLPHAAMAAWLVAASAIMIALRFPLAQTVQIFTAQGRLVRRTVIVGGGPDAESLIAAFERDDVKELHILGVFDDRYDERSADSVAGFPKLGNFDQLSTFCRTAGADLLIVTVPVTAEQRLLHILQRMFTLSVDVRISALSSKLRLSSSAYSYIGRVPMLALMDKPLTDWDRVVKNIEDRVLGTLLLVLAAPVMAAVALAVKLDSKGPVLFKQRRFGFNNELIEVLKFRSMYADAADGTASRLVTRDDARVTRVGRFIRATSLDELPQLFNVIRGQMSLVGPRPHATEAKAQSDLYQSVVDGYYARHRMKPGVTGWAQVNGWRGETDTHEKIVRRVEADLYYIDNWSVLFDLYIIAKTPLALLSRTNAY